MLSGTSILHFIFGLSTFIGLIVVIILTWVNTNQRHYSRILGLFLLLMTYYAFHNLSLYTGLMGNYFPYLFRSARPTLYLPAALVFLYIRAVLYGELRFRQRDLIHLLPVLIYIVDLIPFYAVDKIEKLNQISLFLNNPNNPDYDAKGWLPALFFNLTMPLIMATYLFLAGRLLFIASKNKIDAALNQNKLMFNWLKTYWSIFLLFFILWYLIFIFKGQFPGISYLLLQGYVAGMLLVTTSVALLFYPSILYGFQGGMPLQEKVEEPETGNESEEDLTEEKTVIFSAKQRLHYRQILESLMDEEQPYLKPGYTLTDLAASAGIPYFYVSAIINQEYGSNFNVYINGFRIGYVKKLMEHPKANQYSLSGLAQMAGFGSRSTFARAFQKFENCSPTDYLRRLQPEEQHI
jgi:AraC-like DNA-binding protein